MEQIHFPAIIKCQRVTLKKHSLDLANTMYTHIEKNRERLRQFLPWVDLTNSAEDTLKYIKSTHEKWSQCSEYNYGIFLDTEAVYIGNVGVHSISWPNNRCELGYWIIEDYEGKGFVTDAIRGIEEIAFNLGFNRLEIRCSSLNKRSASLPTRLGYRLEGLLYQDSIERGIYRDTLIFAKLRHYADVGQY